MWMFQNLQVIWTSSSGTLYLCLQCGKVYNTPSLSCNMNHGLMKETWPFSSFLKTTSIPHSLFAVKLLLHQIQASFNKYFVNQTEMFVWCVWLAATGGGGRSCRPGRTSQQRLEGRLVPLARRHENWPQISFYMHCWEERGLLREGESKIRVGAVDGVKLWSCRLWIILLFGE